MTSVTPSGIAPNKLERVAELRRRGIDLSVVLDNEESARLLVDFARSGTAVWPCCWR